MSSQEILDGLHKLEPEGFKWPNMKRVLDWKRERDTEWLDKVGLTAFVNLPWERPPRRELLGQFFRSVTHCETTIRAELHGKQVEITSALIATQLQLPGAENSKDGHPRPSLHIHSAWGEPLRSYLGGMVDPSRAMGQSLKDIQDHKLRTRLFAVSECFFFISRYPFAQPRVVGVLYEAEKWAERGEVLNFSEFMLQQLRVELQMIVMKQTRITSASIWDRLLEPWFPRTGGATLEDLPGHVQVVDLSSDVEEPNTSEEDAYATEEDVEIVPEPIHKRSRLAQEVTDLGRPGFTSSSSGASHYNLQSTPRGTNFGSSHYNLRSTPRDTNTAPIDKHFSGDPLSTPSIVPIEVGGPSSSTWQERRTRLQTEIQRQQGGPRFVNYRVKLVPSTSSSPSTRMKVVATTLDTNTISRDIDPSPPDYSESVRSDHLDGHPTRMKVAATTLDMNTIPRDIDSSPPVFSKSVCSDHPDGLLMGSVAVVANLLESPCYSPVRSDHLDPIASPCSSEGPVIDSHPTIDNEEFCGEKALQEEVQEVHNEAMVSQTSMNEQLKERDHLIENLARDNAMLIADLQMVQGLVQSLHEQLEDEQKTRRVLLQGHDVVDQLLQDMMKGGESKMEEWQDYASQWQKFRDRLLQDMNKVGELKLQEWQDNAHQWDRKRKYSGRSKLRRKLKDT